MQQERTIKLQDNLRQWRQGQKGSRNGGLREECLGKVGRGDMRLEDLGKS